MDQFDQPRQPGPARQRVRLYVEQFLALAREGSQGEDDEQAPRIDVLNHVTLDVRDLRVLSAEPPGNAELDAARARVTELEDAVHLLLEAVDFGHMVTPGRRLYRELRALVPAPPARPADDPNDEE